MDLIPFPTVGAGGGFEFRMRETDPWGGLGHWLTGAKNMACATCRKSILFGGKRAGSRRYCSKRCFDADHLGRLADAVPETRVDEVAAQLRRSRCRSCRKEGELEIFKSYTVFSVILFTRWREKPEISCRSCARGRQFKDMMFSLALGWWGFPFGLVITPVVLLMNGAAMIHNPLGKPPSKALRAYARLVVANELARMQREGGPQSALSRFFQTQDQSSTARSGNAVLDQPD